MNNTSLAQSYFELITAKSPADAFSFLQGVINPPTFETDWLDFKCGRIAKNDDSIKENWSKALSAFANTEGGVLVCGIDARQNANGVDAAQAVELVPNPAVLKSRLEQLLVSATDPPVQGVRIESISDPTNPNQGFVVCLVPESSHKPHRAEFSQRRYYLRVGSHSTEPSPSILRSLFYPRANPRLEVTVTPFIRQSIACRGHFTAEFKFVLENTGTATANEIFVVIDTGRPNFEFDHREWDAASGHQGRALAAKRPLHPGGCMTIGVTQFSSIQCEQTASGFRVTNSSQQVDIIARLFARDMEPVLAKMSFNQIEIEQQVAKVGIVHPLRP